MACQDWKHNACRFISLCLLGCILLYPNLIYLFANASGATYLLTSILYALPLLALVGLLPKRWMYIVAVVLLSVTSIIDLTMVDLYNSYLLPGTAISAIKTNPQEASEFYHTNLSEVLHWFPVIVMCVISCITYHRPKYNKVSLVAGISAILLQAGFVAAKMTVSYHSALTPRFFIDNRILNRPPYNVFFQSVNTAKELHKRAMMSSAKDTDFGATRFTPPVAKYTF